ncbi:MAG: hypothetical protein CO189_01725 [candidate division Zixibacteria bacterium CG_4_9_14_3_um_filter_46_8]|nr:MAG: hypothetical protein CO189_01725 [candidate division Zixibacteria bacterium CG_4_9_14_3_um_filter_46_8]
MEISNTFIYKENPLDLFTDFIIIYSLIVWTVQRRLKVTEYRSVVQRHSNFIYRKTDHVRRLI